MTIRKTKLMGWSYRLTLCFSEGERLQLITHGNVRAPLNHSIGPWWSHLFSHMTFMHDVSTHAHLHPGPLAIECTRTILCIVHSSKQTPERSFTTNKVTNQTNARSPIQTCTSWPMMCWVSFCWMSLPSKEPGAPLHLPRTTRLVSGFPSKISLKCIPVAASSLRPIEAPREG